MVYVTWNTDVYPLGEIMRPLGHISSPRGYQNITYTMQLPVQSACVASELSVEIASWSVNLVAIFDFIRFLFNIFGNFFRRFELAPQSRIRAPTIRTLLGRFVALTTDWWNGLSRLVKIVEAVYAHVVSILVQFARSPVNFFAAARTFLIFDNAMCVTIWSIFDQKLQLWDQFVWRDHRWAIK